MTSCSSKDKKDPVKEAIKEGRELAKEAAENNTDEAPDFEDLAMKGLKAYNTKDLKAMKSMAFMASAMNMDEAFMESRNKKYMQNWDGKIHAMKFRNDYGMKQALAYYADVPDSEDDELFVYIVQVYGDKWYPSSEFDKIPRAEFEARWFKMGSSRNEAELMRTTKEDE